MLPATKNWFSEASETLGLAMSLTLTANAKVHEQQTPFQKIEIYETDTFGNLMVIDGFVMLTSRDNFLYHEMMSHPVLFTHPDPKNVLIIGGGDCGTLREVLRHPNIVRAVQVDIDEGVTRAAEQFFPELCESNGDPRAEILFDDGIRYIQQSKAGEFDIIIVDSTDPVGPAEGLFGKKFYSDCQQVLGSNGILVHQSESPLLHRELMREMHNAMRDAGFIQQQPLLFPQPTYPSGWWSATMATANPQAGCLRQIRSEASNLPFASQYYTAAIHQGALSLPPFLQQALQGS